ncbi:hypothetical protein KCU90_g147, partial [Aureobasidium melanogenum]
MDRKLECRQSNLIVHLFEGNLESEHENQPVRFMSVCITSASILSSVNGHFSSDGVQPSTSTYLKPWKVCCGDQFSITLPFEMIVSMAAALRRGRTPSSPSSITSA